MLNQCNFIGNLGSDPEIRSTQNGDKVANLSIGVSEKWKDKNGQQQSKTEWVRVVIWGKLADIAEQYLQKGSKVYVSGKMQTRKWTDQNGNEKYSTEIVLQGFDSKLVMLDSREGGQSPNFKDQNHQASYQAQAPQDDADSEIPW